MDNTESSKTLFNYAKFLKALNPARLECKVKNRTKSENVTMILPIIILLVKSLILNGTIGNIQS